jgi:SAM-dependent methyltransferase
MHEKRFNGGIERLRVPERVARLEVERVVDLCLQGIGLKNVLDVGTGSGLFAEAFFKRGLEVTAVDANPNMLPVARYFIPKADFCQAEAETLRRVSRRRVCILEWLYIEAEFGPPLAHRMNPTSLAELSEKTGFLKMETLPLSHLVFYRLTR